LSADYHVNRT